MKKSFIIASIVGLGGLSVLQTACDNYDDLIPQEYNCILSLQNYGEQEVVLYRTGEDTKVEITTLKTGNVPTSTALASIEPMSEIQFAEYKVNTGRNYKYLPQECYEIQEGDLSYGEDQRWLKSTVSIKFDETERYFNGTDEYVIPLMLTSESDSCLSSRRELMLKISDLIIPSIGFEQTQINIEEDLIGDGTMTYELPVKMPIENNWDFSFDVEVDPSSANGYLLANSNACTIEIEDFVAGADAKVKLTIDKSKLNFGLQIVPLRIKSCEYPGFEINSAQSLAVVTFHKTVSRSELSEISVPAENIDGYGWATYDWNPDGSGTVYHLGWGSASVLYDGTGKSALFDGNLDSFWHGDWYYGANDPTYGQYIDFKLTNSATHFAYDLWARHDNQNACPTVTDIYGSTDGQNWVKLKTVKSSLSQPREKFESSVCSSATPFNYIRFAVVESNNGNVRLPKITWACGEMKLYAK